MNQPQTESELSSVRGSVQRGSPFGGEAWTTTMAAELGLQATLRSRGRPKGA